MVKPFTSEFSPYFFLYYYGLWVGKLLDTFIFPKYPKSVDLAHRFLQVLQKVSHSFLFSWATTLLYLPLFFYSVFLSLDISLDLGCELLKNGTVAGGAYLRSHLAQFYFLFFPVIVYSVIAPFLFLGVGVTLSNNVLRNEEERENEYLLLESRIKRLDNTLFYSFLFITLFAFCALFGSFEILLKETQAVVEGIAQQRLLDLAPLAKSAGIDALPGESPSHLVCRIEQKVESTFMEYVISSSNSPSSSSSPSGAI
jgi:hypothetical protein